MKYHMLAKQTRTAQFFVNCFLKEETKFISTKFSHRIHTQGSKQQLRLLRTQSSVQWLGHEQTLTEGLNAALTVAFSAAPSHPCVTFCLPCPLRTESSLGYILASS